MQILYSRCCGIDVHKNSVTACVLVYASAKEPEVRQMEFPTHFKALGNPRLWLLAQRVTHVVLESTGVTIGKDVPVILSRIRSAFFSPVVRKPVWQALEGHFELVLGNPFQVKIRPGKKTDAADSQWLALLRDFPTSPASGSASGLAAAMTPPLMTGSMPSDLFRIPESGLIEKSEKFEARVNAPGFEPGEVKVTALPDAPIVKGYSAHKHNQSDGDVRFYESGKGRIAVDGAQSRTKGAKRAAIQTRLIA